MIPARFLFFKSPHLKSGGCPGPTPGLYTSPRPRIRFRPLVYVSVRVCFLFFWHVIVPLSCFRIATYFFLLRFRTLFKKVKTKLAVQKETRSLELLSISETHTL